MDIRWTCKVEQSGGGSKETSHGMTCSAFPFNHRRSRTNSTATLYVSAGGAWPFNGHLETLSTGRKRPRHSIRKQLPPTTWWDVEANIRRRAFLAAALKRFFRLAFRLPISSSHSCHRFLALHVARKHRRHSMTRILPFRWSETSVWILATRRSVREFLSADESYPLQALARGNREPEPDERRTERRRTQRGKRKKRKKKKKEGGGGREGEGEGGRGGGGEKWIPAIRV